VTSIRHFINLVESAQSASRPLLEVGGNLSDYDYMLDVIYQQNKERQNG
jgi:hypothetical protein